MNKNLKRMHEMSVKKLVVIMAIPAIVSMFVQALYNVVDSIFIAQLGEEALTALSLAFPLQIVVIAVAVGLAIGVNSYVSRKLGEGRKDLARSAAEHGIVLSAVAWLVLCVLNYFVGAHYFQMFTDDALVLKYSLQYTNIVIYGSIGVILSMVLVSIKQATGDMISPMKVQLLGAGINMVLDPILIFGLLTVPALGVVGGATASVIGQLTSMLYAFGKLRHSALELRLSTMHREFKFDRKIVQEVLRIGLPTMFVQGLGAVMVGCINYILVGFSELAVAAFGAFFKVNAVLYMPLIGLTQGMMPVVGVNFGAKNLARVKGAIKYSLLYSLGLTIVGSTGLIYFAEPMMHIFSDVPALIEMGATCMRVMSVGFVLFGVTLVIISTFQAFGIARLSFCTSILRQLALLIPMAYIFSRFFGVFGVWIAFPLTEGIGMIFAIAYGMRLYKTKIRPLMRGAVQGA